MSINKLIRIICCVLCITACSLTLFGCSDKDKDAIVTFPADISALADFKCECSTAYETEFVIEDEGAKALYTYITEQWENAEETEIDRTEQDCIYLSFQDGEPSFILSQEISGVFDITGVRFYGVFWIYENDYMVYTAAPMTSFQEEYKMPEGTYNKIAEMIAK